MPNVLVMFVPQSLFLDWNFLYLVKVRIVIPQELGVKNLTAEARIPGQQHVSC